MCPLGLGAQARTVEGMSRCRAESFYLSPSDKRSFAQWRVTAAVGGAEVEITHRGDLARLARNPEWNHLVTVTARDGSVRERRWLDERVVEGHLPASEADQAAWAAAAAEPVVVGAGELEGGTEERGARRARRRGRRGGGGVRVSHAARPGEPAAVEALRSHPVISGLGAAFARRGRTLRLVGGSVRDAFADRVGDDLDFTTDATPTEVKAIVAGIGSIWDANGEQYGTVGVDVQGFKVEITQHRHEVYSADSRNPVVELGGTLLEDLARRDFTINAIALDAATGEVIDPFDGVGAFQRGVIDVPGGDPLSTMSEDPLRCVRAARFAAKFGFEIAPRTREAISDPEVRDRLERLISTERTTAELTKMLGAGGATAARFLSTCNDLGITRAVLKDIPARPERVAALERLGEHVSSEVVLATLVAGEEGSSAKLGKLKLKTQQIKEVCRIAEITETLGRLEENTPGARVRSARALVLDHDDDTLGAALQVLAVLGPERSEEARALVASAQREEPNVRAGLPVTGEDALALGLRGPVVGRGLQAVRTALIADPGLSAAGARQILAEIGAAAPPQAPRRKR